jgi:isoamylase
MKNGRPYPLGATLSDTGANFCVYSSHATGVQLMLFSGELDAPADRVLLLDASVNRTAHYWHPYVDGIQSGQGYVESLLP